MKARDPRFVIGLLQCIACAAASSVDGAENTQATLLEKWALSRCLAKAGGDTPAGDDAAKTAAAYLEMGAAGIEVYEELEALVGSHLEREYTGSVKSNYDTMKCLDLYDSDELHRLARGVGGRARTHAGTGQHPHSDSAPKFVEMATSGGKTIRAPVGGDEYVRRDAGVDVQVIAEMESSLVVVETYLSRPGGGSYCQAGEERFLRVLRLEDDGARVTLQLKLASCWQTIELAESGVEWSPVDATLHIRWLLGPTNRMQPEELVLRLQHP